MKVKDQGSIRNKSIYLALGVSLTGEKELLGLWVSWTPAIFYGLLMIIGACYCGVLLVCRD